MTKERKKIQIIKIGKEGKCLLIIKVMTIYTDSSKRFNFKSLVEKKYMNLNFFGIQ